MTALTAPLHIAQLVAPGTAGGLESVVRLLAAGIARRGETSSLVAVTTAGDPEPSWLQELAVAGVTVVQLRMTGRAYYREFTAITEKLKQLHPDIAHSHGYRSDVLGSMSARRLGIPTVATVHGFTGGGWKNRLYEWMQCRAFRRFAAVVAVSRPLANRLRREGVPAARVHLIPNAWGPTNAPLGRAEARGLLGLPQDAPIVGWVGRLSREKGADVMLDAFSRIPNPALRLAFVGEGRERVALMAQAVGLGISERVTWHGLVPDAGRIYSAFDVFAITSRTEGTPIALFEAMHAGTPVVATRVGGVPDVVGQEEALLVESEDPAAVAEAIGRILRDPGLALRLIEAAARRLRADYALDPWLDQYLQLYRDIR